jgi:hypothetical protein
LTGKAETPKGDPDGRGTAEIKVTGRQVCWEIKVSGVLHHDLRRARRRDREAAGGVLRERAQREVPGRCAARAAQRRRLTAR